MLHDALIAETTGSSLDPAPWSMALASMKAGGHAAAITSPWGFDFISLSMRVGGFEVRDSLIWLSGDPRIVILARVPSPLSTTETVHRHSVGALNIESCRIATDENLNGGAYAKNGGDRYDGYEKWRFKRTRGRSMLEGDTLSASAAGIVEFVQPSGRWPSNLLHDGGPKARDILRDQARFFPVLDDTHALRTWLVRLILPEGGSLLTL